MAKSKSFFRIGHSLRNCLMPSTRASILSSKPLGQTRHRLFLRYVKCSNTMQYQCSSKMRGYLKEPVLGYRSGETTVFGSKAKLDSCSLLPATNVYLDLHDFNVHL